MAHQEPRDRGVAVRKVERIRAAVGIARGGKSHMRGRARLKIKALKAGKAESPDVQRGDRVDADAPFAVRACLVEGDGVRICLHDIQQEVAIAHLRQSGFLFGRRQAGKVVDVCFLYSGDVALCLWRQRGLRQKLRPRKLVVGNNELVRAKSFLVEKQTPAKTERSIKSPIQALIGQRNGIDAECFQKTISHGAVRPWAVDVYGAAIDQRQAAAKLKLVSLGVTAEIIMIVENEDAGVRMSGAVKIGGRKP